MQRSLMCSMLFAVVATSANGQAPAPTGFHRLAPSSPDYPLIARGLHLVGIEVGILSRTSTGRTGSGGSASAESRVSGFVGAVRYAYWPDQYWTIGASVGLIAAESGVSLGPGGEVVESAAVVPLLASVRLYPLQLSLSDVVRPWGSLAIGPYLGFETVAGVGSSADAALGARARVGVDVFPGKLVQLGFSLGYNFVTSFERPIGNDRNYSGLEASLSTGITIGTRRE